MANFNTIEEVADKIKSDLTAQNDKKSIALLYAFNATGKTRLSVEFDNLNENENGEIKVLSYNAFLEDLFVWNNDDYILEIKSHWVIELIKEQGLENDIIDNFKLLTNSKIEPQFDFANNQVVFAIVSGDDATAENIKISKSEESLLVWSIFYSILEVAIDALNTKEEDRTTDKFNHLEYIVIDDPVSSIDDERIISLAVKLFELVKSSESKGINFLITTHHALFFNVLFNSFRKLPKSEAKKYFYIFSKNENILVLENQNDDSPFAYHILVKNKIQEAIENDNLEKYHFNLFRTLLEKTASFLGYNNWSDCILDEDNKAEIVRIVNLYSHSKLSDLESGSLSNTDKELFKLAFKDFIKNFKFKGYEQE